MSIKSDYLLDMVARFFAAVMAGLEKAGGGDAPGSIDDFEGVVAGVLDMDGACVLELSSSSLVAMMQLSAVDESLAVYSVYALMKAAEQYDLLGSGTACVRREQARALAVAYGFDVDVTPAEVEEALHSRGSL